MDNFNIPKKINRHVLKALHLLSNGNNQVKVPTVDIIDQVRYQVRNLVPVPNVVHVIQMSLQNLSACGIITQTSVQSYSLGTAFRPPPQSRGPYKPDKSIFLTSPHKQESSSNLDPNSRYTAVSKDSLANNNPDVVRKRLRTQKKINLGGRRAHLPKARRFKPNRSAKICRSISKQPSLILNNSVLMQCAKSSKKRGLPLNKNFEKLFNTCNYDSKCGKYSSNNNIKATCGKCEMRSHEKDDIEDVRDVSRLNIETKKIEF